jgi:uncharacterized repeat protein (TIGR02059 family)
MVVIKKSILLVFFLAISLIVSGTTYYISSAGNDAANGLSEATAWKTTAKVNSAFSTFKPGDKILFRRGDIFYGTINVTVAGSAGNPITIGAYGTGNGPVISGFTTLTEWTSYGDGIYYKAVSAESTPNVLSLDVANTPLGRTPNLPSPNGWPSNIPTVESGSSASMTASGVQTSPSLVGADVVIRTQQWVTERRTITGHSNHTLSYASTEYAASAGSGYFIENDISCLNVYGEWCYRNGNVYMYFGGSDNPTNHTIKVSVRNYGINCSKSYVTIDGLTIEGADQYLIYSNGTNNIIQNCTLRFSGKFGIYGSQSYLATLNNTITQCNETGVYASGGTNTTISGNNISYSGMISGMGGSDDGGYCGIVCGGANSLITLNSITYSGYDGINWGGQNSEVSYNFINWSCMNKADGAGAYTYRGSATGKVIKYNIIMNSQAQPYGWSYQDETSANGIYFDGSDDVNCHHNVLAYNQGKGIFVNADQRATIEYNTCYANKYGIYVFSEGVANGADGTARGHVIRYNTLVAKKTDDYSLCAITKLAASDLPLIGIIDYNHYAKPISNSQYIFTEYSAWGGPNQRITIAEMSSQLGFDTHSTASAITLTDVNKIRFEYNETSSNKVVALDAGYVDAVGTKYSGSITLLPFTGVVLMVDPNPGIAPAAPVYTNSSIENATPSVLVMNYDLTLGNVVPSASAFSVMVNSTARTVNSVVVSGTKVQLTLASPILYGDVVTVSYTKPSANPIQTPAGGQAITINAKPVTNRVGPSAVPIYLGATVEDATPALLQLDYDLALANVLPAVSSLSVTVNSLVMKVQSVSISGTSVILTLAYEILYGDVVTVAYTKPSSNLLQSTTGLIVPTMSGQIVKNKVNPNGPVYLSSSIENSAPNILKINFDEIVETSVPGVSSFVVMVNGVKASITSVSISGNTVLLTLAVPVVFGDNITVSYIKPSSNELKKATGETAVSFSSPQPVTNNCTNLAGNSLKKGSITIYPNPAREFINISILETSLQPQLLKIFDLSGRLFLESQINSGTSSKVLINLKSGIYIVQVVSGSIINFVQKLIVL